LDPRRFTKRWWGVSIEDYHCEQLAGNSQGGQVFTSYLSYLLFLHLLFTLMSIVLSQIWYMKNYVSLNGSCCFGLPTRFFP
jgi:hypothetical protein